MITPSIVFGADKISLNSEFPVVEGKYRMTDEWSIILDRPHNRRVEEGSLDCGVLDSRYG
jgi:hypothetical protein